MFLAEMIRTLCREKSKCTEYLVTRRLSHSSKILLNLLTFKFQKSQKSSVKQSSKINSMPFSPRVDAYKRKNGY